MFYWTTVSEPGPGLYLARAVDIVYTVVILLLLTRFILRLIGADPVAPVVPFIYHYSSLVLVWFAGILPDIPIEEGYVIELSTLVAMLIYALIRKALVWLLVSLFP